MGEWLPIESAPRDGKPFMIWCNASYGELSGLSENLGFHATAFGEPDSAAEPVRYGNAGAWYSGDGDYYATWNRATHWMPLPAPPEPQP